MPREAAAATVLDLHGDDWHLQPEPELHNGFAEPVEVPTEKVPDGDHFQPFEGLPHAEVLALEHEEQRYLVDDLIPAAAVGTIAGVPETHKSFTAQSIAVKCASGTGEILGRQVLAKTRVGYFWQDDSEREEAERVKLYEEVHAAGSEAALWWFLNPGIGLPEDLGRLRATVEHYQLGLVVLDSFYSVVAGIDLRDQTAEQTILLLKRDLADPTGCTVLIVDHMPWATDTNRGRLRGYGGVHKGAAIRFGIYIDAEGKKLYAEARGNNIKGFKKTPVYWDTDALELRLIDIAQVDQDELDQRVTEYVNQHPGASTNDVEKGVTGSRDSIRKALERLSTDGDSPANHKVLAPGPGRQARGKYWYPANHAVFSSPGEPQANPGEPSPRVSQGPGSPESPLPRRGANSDGEPVDDQEIERLAALAEEALA